SRYLGGRHHLPCAVTCSATRGARDRRTALDADRPPAGRPGSPPCRARSAGAAAKLIPRVASLADGLDAARSVTLLRATGASAEAPQAAPRCSHTPSTTETA